MSKKKDTFIFKKSWADALKKRSIEVQLEVYNAIVSYAVDGVTPEMSEIAEVVFDFIKLEIDENNAKYEEVVNKRRQAGKRGMESRYSNKAENEQYNERDNKPNTTNNTSIEVTNDNKTNKCYQKVTNVTNITDSVSDSVSDSVIIKKETISNEIVKKEAELLPLPLDGDAVLIEDDMDLLDDSIIAPVASKKIDYARIVNLYHEICVKLPKVKVLSDERKAKIKLRFKEIGNNYLRIEELFYTVASSDFLNGNNDRAWTADFDWIFQNKTNWVRIMEGRYSNRENTASGGRRSELEKNFGLLDSMGVQKENVIF